MGQDGLVWAVTAVMRRHDGRHGRDARRDGAVMAAMPPAVMAASTASSRKPISVEIQLQFPAVFGPDFPPFDWISSQLTGNPSQIAVDRPEWAPKGPTVAVTRPP